MSGPKISIYDLSPWARNNLNGQIRCERDCVACAQQISNFLREATSYRLQIENLITASELMASRGVEPAVSQEELQNLNNRLLEESETIRKKLQEKMPTITGKYEINDAALAQKKAELERVRSLKKLAEGLRNDLDKAVYQGENSRIAATSKIEGSIAVDLSGYFSFDDLAPDDDGSNAQELIKAIEDKLIQIQKTEKLPEELSCEITQAIASLSRVTTIESAHLFKSVTVKNLENHIADYKSNLVQQQEAFADEVARYQVLCIMLDKAPVSYSFSAEASATLKREIEAMEMAIIKQNEQQYISECVDQVMSEMGYDLIGTRDVKKRNGKQFHNELYAFDEGTAVNVTYSSDGQIAMELGGISREDRLPTAEETQVLTGDMETFCGEFAEFEKRLRAKGVILGNRIAMSPPSADYAAIINVNDYELDSSKQFSEISVAHKKKAKATEKKALRRND